MTFVLIGFFSYPYTTILFGKWPIRPSDLKQPEAGLAELGWTTMLTMFYYTILIVPFWGLIYGVVFGKSYGLGTPWWGGIAGTMHVHWVFGWWEWAIILLFMTPNVWRMKPWSVIKLPQPWKGFISLILTFRGRLYPGPDLCPSRGHLVEPGRGGQAPAARATRASPPVFCGTTPPKSPVSA